MFAYPKITGIEVSVVLAKEDDDLLDPMVQLVLAAGTEIGAISAKKRLVSVALVDHVDYEITG